MRKPSSVCFHHLQALPCGLAERRLVEQHAEALARAAADAAAQLMQLGEAEALGVLDHHDVGVGHVDPDLDHGRRDEDLEPPFGEIRHGGILGLVRHPAMQQADVLRAEHLRKVRMALLRRREVGHVRALDQRAHPVDLGAVA